jgi:hypothetical protein
MYPPAAGISPSRLGLRLCRASDGGGPFENPHSNRRIQPSLPWPSSSPRRSTRMMCWQASQAARERRVARVLAPITAQNLPPVRSVNGLNDCRSKTVYIEPGSPWQTGYNESLNGKFRDELLNHQVFCSSAKAQHLVEARRQFPPRPCPCNRPTLPDEVGLTGPSQVTTEPGKIAAAAE